MTSSPSLAAELMRWLKRIAHDVRLLWLLWLLWLPGDRAEKLRLLPRTRLERDARAVRSCCARQGPCIVSIAVHPPIICRR